MRRALLLGLALGGGALAQSSGHAGHGTASTSMEEMNGRDLAALRPLKDRAFEIAFLKAMTEHHLMAVHMARGLLNSSKNEQVRQAAKQVISAQQKEIAAMLGWLKARYGVSYRSDAQPMPWPKTSVDRAFLSGMIPHHQGAVEMAKLVPTRTQNRQIRMLAADIIKSQTAEINQYRAWLKVVK